MVKKREIGDEKNKKDGNNNEIKYERESEIGSERRELCREFGIEEKSWESFERMIGKGINNNNNNNSSNND